MFAALKSQGILVHRLKQDFLLKKKKKARELTRTLMISYSQNIYNLKYYNFLLS